MRKKWSKSSELSPGPELENHYQTVTLANMPRRSPRLKKVSLKKPPKSTIFFFYGVFKKIRLISEKLHVPPLKLLGFHRGYIFVVIPKSPFYTIL